ncbi:MAG: SLBB domain-containing protein [Nevskia sp.]
MIKRTQAQSAILKSFLLLCALPLAVAQAQLPFDPSAIDQLTPEQRQKALETLGASGTGPAAQAQSDGKFRDQSLPNPLEANKPARKAEPAEPAPSEQVKRGVAKGEAKDDLASGPSEQGLKPFGYDLFRRAATTFAPATDIPIPSDYVLGPGDSIRVQLFGNENGNYSLQVARDGHINFPKLGPISVAGQRFDDVKTSLSERIGRELIGVQSSISLGELRSVRVFLTGDVNQPGSYTVSSLATITNALFVGGGVSIVGSLRSIQLKRNGRLVRTLDLYALLLHGDSSGDERLQPGDVIFVPPVGPRVSADGEVKRPAIYELKGERSVSEIIALAGGLLASTNTSTAQVERYEGNRKTVRQVDIARSADLALRVQDGDLLRVGSIAKRLENNVRVIGYVKYPGAFQWSEGYPLKAVLEAAQIQSSDTGTETYLALGLVERTDPQSGVRGWLSFNVQAVLSGQAPAFPLQRDDLVVILNRADVSYLDSREVRAVAAGDARPVKRCPALEGLVRLVNTERSIRFLKAFTTESTRNGQSSKQVFDEASCPEVFRQVPRALQYLLEESVAVYGEVRRPGLYPVARDTPLKLLIETAGGLSNESDASNIEYISYQDALKNGSSHYSTIDLKQADAAVLKVNPGDLFNFKALYLGQEVGTVRLSGEFRFPGSYGILRGEHLSQLIKRAGGLTSNSYAYGAVFTRASARIAEEESYRRAAADLQDAAVTALTSGALGRDAQISTQFLTAASQQLRDAKAIGRVVIEADPTILEARPEIDPILEPGDVLLVPKRPISVAVIGQVLNPGSLAFTPGASLKQYVERAGGYSQAADESRVFVILPNGTAQKFQSSFWNYRSQDIPPGSVIVVPRDPAPFNALAFSERIFGVLSSLALTAAALATVTR